MLLNASIRKFISFERVSVLHVDAALSAVGHNTPHSPWPVEVVIVRNMAKAFAVVSVVIYADLQAQKLELFP